MILLCAILSLSGCERSEALARYRALAECKMRAMEHKISDPAHARHCMEAKGYLFSPLACHPVGPPEANTDCYAAP